MIDSLIVEFDKALRTLFAAPSTTRELPGQCLPEAALSESEKAHAGALMRVNHVGEICAQALYRGQAIACRNPEIRRELDESADEEVEHLAWTERRLHELAARKSLLNPLWYVGALSLGVAAGRLGDGWSLGFLAETERQVEAHLDHHLSELPAADARSRAVLQQMKADEISHAEKAVRLGARELPAPVKSAMRAAAGVMTHLAYHV